jgi:hypothetical protein
MSYHIEGRRWFKENTYHSVRIFKDSECIAYLPWQYGYGDFYIETALQWLEQNNEIPLRERHSNGSQPGGTLFVRETLKSTYSVIDVQRKKDL